MIKDLIHLEDLNLSGCSFAAQLSPLQYLTNLRSLDLNGLLLNEEEFQFLPLKNLKKLSLNNNLRFSNKELELIIQCQELTHLFLSWTKVNDEGLLKLKSLPHLTHIELGGCKITGEVFKELGELPLTYLSLKGCTELTSDFLQHLKSFKNLQTLDIRGCYRLKYKDVQALQAEMKIPNLLEN